MTGRKKSPKPRMTVPNSGQDKAQEQSLGR